MNDYIYFDNAATTTVLPEVNELIFQINRSFFGNPSSLHELGFESEKVVTAARKKIASLLNVTPDTIYFTSGATEANNWAIDSSFKTRKNRGTRMICDAGAHASVMEKLLSMKDCADIQIADLDHEGIIRKPSLINLLSEKTIFVSLLLVNNETGVIQNTAELIPLIREKSPGAIIHIDAVQALAKTADLNYIKNSDMLSGSAHKFGGPKGIGFLYVKKGINLRPLLYGGGQERRMRGGTENVTAISAMARALEISINKNSVIHDQLNKIKTEFATRLKDNIKDLKINADGVTTSPYILNLSLKDTRGEILVHALEEDNIYISTGSACKSKDNTLSHVLEAMKIAPEWIDGTIRISFSDIPDKAELDKTIEKIKEAAQRIRQAINF